MKEILNDTVENKIEAVEKIWNSIQESALPVTDEEVSIARERHEEYLKNPKDVILWKDAKAKLMKKYSF